MKKDEIGLSCSYVFFSGWSPEKQTEKLDKNFPGIRKVPFRKGKGHRLQDFGKRKILLLIRNSMHSFAQTTFPIVNTKEKVKS